ncbi:MAG: cupin domain-containing protein [Sedimentisphaerales bacterium]
MPTIKDVIVKKPSDEEAETCKAWPVWKCEPSKFDWEYTEKETCLLLEGKVTVSDSTDSVSFGPGDLVIFPKDLDCTWHVTEAVTKHYNFG